MVGGALLDALEGVARHVRRRDKPFGGIQLVLSGAPRLRCPEASVQSVRLALAVCPASATWGPSLQVTRSGAGLASCQQPRVFPASSHA